MKGLKKHIALVLSTALLLCFSVTILPFDLLHNHAAEVNTACHDASGNTCDHKFHLSDKAKTCWVCGIHYDKTFTLDTAQATSSVSTKTVFFNEGTITEYIFKLFFGALRGPPTN